MSWCRWSSDDWRSDFYVYESHSGVEVHVAGGRHEIDRSALPARAPAELAATQWLARHRAIMELVERAPIVPIGLPHDGASRTFDTLTEAADWIDELVALGYHAPEGLTSDMREYVAEVTP